MNKLSKLKKYNVYVQKPFSVYTSTILCSAQGSLFTTLISQNISNMYFLGNLLILCAFIIFPTRAKKNIVSLDVILALLSLDVCVVVVGTTPFHP